MRVIQSVAGVLAILFAAGPGYTSMIVNHTGISSPDLTITFSEVVLGPEAPVTTEYAAYGVTFSPSLYYNTQPIFFPTESLANFDFNGGLSNPVDIFFATPQTAAAMAVQTNPGTTTFTAYLNGVLVEQFTVPTTLSILPDVSEASNFYGFEGILFDQLQILSNTTYFQMDNLQLSAAAVPEPAGLTLVGLGAFGLLGGVIRRRRPDASA